MRELPVSIRTIQALAMIAATPPTPYATRSPGQPGGSNVARKPNAHAASAARVVNSKMAHTKRRINSVYP